MPKKYKFRTSFTFDGKRYQIYADTERELYQKAERRRLELEKGHVYIESSMSFTSWSKTCIETYKTKCSDRTKRNFVYLVKSNIDPIIGSYSLKSIKPLHCQQVLNGQRGRSSSQIAKVHQAMNFIFGKAVQEGLINSNPAEFLEKPAGFKLKRRALTEEEQQYFTKVALTDTKFYAYLMMLYCGCRPSEAYNCKGNDIIVRDGFYYLHVRGTKTASADRVVPLPQWLYDLFKNTKADDYICHTRTNKMVKFNYRQITWEVFKNKINIAMGCEVYRNKPIPPYPLASDIVQYCLRHTYCTNLAKKGIDIRTAQKLMGHTDIRMTANIYTHIDMSDLEKAARILADV